MNGSIRQTKFQRHIRAMLATGTTPSNALERFGLVTYTGVFRSRRNGPRIRLDRGTTCRGFSFPTEGSHEVLGPGRQFEKMNVTLLPFCPLNMHETHDTRISQP
jgi:hypothetical protein